MELAPLATAADLSARGITTGNIDRALEVASAVIRDAAGVPISRVTATVTVPAPVGDTLLSLPGPISSIASVEVDGTPVTDYINAVNALWRSGGWASAPVPVKVTYTFGLGTVPADIVDLTCNLAKAWLDHVAAGGGSTAGLASVRVDDAAETYTAEGSAQVSPVYLPKATRDWLAARFGGGAVVVETLR